MFLKTQGVHTRLAKEDKETDWFVVVDHIIAAAASLTMVVFTFVMFALMFT